MDIGLFAHLWIYFANMDKKIHAKNLTRIWIIGYSCRIISGLKKYLFFQSKLALVRIKIKFPYDISQIFYVSRKDLKFEDSSISINFV